MQMLAFILMKVAESQIPGCPPLTGENSSDMAVQLSVLCEGKTGETKKNL